MQRGLLLGALVAAVVLAGCTAQGCSGAQGSGGQQGVCNNPDNFYYGLQGVKSGTESYTWQNSGTSASVSWGAQGAGSATLTITDAAGKQVLRQSFTGGQAGGQMSTASGQPGAWTIRIAFDGFSGQGGLAITKK